MSIKENPDFSSAIGALIIAFVSSFISITQRILRGYPASVLWVFSEFMAAMLCGYLVWDIYPLMADSLPNWLSMPILVAFAAHVGGRSFQALEGVIYRKWGVEFQPDTKPTRPRKRVVKPDPEPPTQIETKE